MDEEQLTDKFGAYISEPESPQQGCAGIVAVIIVLGLLAIAYSYAVENQRCINPALGCLLLILPKL